MSQPSSSSGYPQNGTSDALNTSSSCGSRYDVVARLVTTCCAGECHTQDKAGEESAGSRNVSRQLTPQEELDKSLLEAVWRGSLEDTQTALENGAGIEGPSIRSWGSFPRGLRRPLLLATKTGNTQVVEMLLEHSADVNAINEDGWTALFFAAQRGDSQLTRILLAHGGDPRKTDRSGLNALDYSKDLVMRRTFEQSLAERGIPAPRLKELAPPIVRPRRDSRERQNFSSVVNAVDKASGRTALHFAAIEGVMEVCQRILGREDFQAVNHKDKDGNTALFYAVEFGHTDICHLIRKAGGNLTGEDATDGFSSFPPPPPEESVKKEHSQKIIYYGNEQSENEYSIE